MNKRKPLRKVLGSPHNIRFDEIRGLVEAFGFRPIQTSESHHIFAHPEIAELVNLQAGQPGTRRAGMSDYHINIFASDEDGGYIADIPDLALCSAFGATPEAALAQVLVAKAAWMEASEALGRPIPPPKYRPAIYQVA